MFIRKTSQIKNGTRYNNFRLVESYRAQTGMKQRVLLSLGSEFELPENKWKSLSARLGEILKNQTSLFAAEEAVEKWAQKIVKALLKKSPSLRKGDESGALSQFESVDVDSLEYRDVRTVGAEHVALETLRYIGLEKYLESLDFNRVEQVAAIGTLVARMIHPGSDRETARWLHETSGLGELLDFDIARVSLDKIYEVSDKILKHKVQLEEFLYKQETSLFKLKRSIVLYDLTNTYLEGSGKYNDKAAHGRSKEKRKDCKLVTLALSLDEDGFPRQSKILKGNISEPKTLEETIASLGASGDIKQTIIMDAGLATDQNLAFLRSKGHPYLVMSREKRVGMPEGGEVITLKAEGDCLIQVKLVDRPETGEKQLYCYSKARAEKELGIDKSFSSRYEEELTKLLTGLGKPKTIKTHEKVLEKIGRLKQKYAFISGCYDVKIELAPQETSKEKSIRDKKNTVLVRSISWTRVRETELAGQYCLRSYKTKLSPKELWKTYVMLTDIESAFRSMKSELGLRPIFHQKTSRVDAHIFISLLGYHILHSIRFQLKKHGIDWSWSTLRQKLAHQARITSTFNREDNSVVHIRKSSNPTVDESKIYDLLKIKKYPGITEKYVI